MKAKLVFFSIVFSFLLTCNLALSQQSNVIREELVFARYMVDGQECDKSNQGILGWDKSQLTICTYKVTDCNKNSNKKCDKETKYGKVILANITAQDLLNWVETGCKEKLHNYNSSAIQTCTEKFSNRIKSQSGGQFPVLGVVWEDMYPVSSASGICSSGHCPDGIFEKYFFRNGVTLRSTIFENGSTARLTDEQLKSGINGDDNWISGGKSAYARPIGTSRDMFSKCVGFQDWKQDIFQDPELALKWSDKVGEITRESIGKPENFLVTCFIVNAK